MKKTLINILFIIIIVSVSVILPSFVFASTEINTLASSQPASPLTAQQMFHDADLVVKGVMLSLIAMSVVSWTLFIAKTWELSRLKRTQSQQKQVIAMARDAQHADLLCRKAGISCPMLSVAVNEMASSNSMYWRELQDRISTLSYQYICALKIQANKHTGVLATISSTAPFIGLFGTVWGVMNSFMGIATTQSTDLSVVAPGIAEALLATGVGLFAAIPAVIIYNYFTRQIHTIGYLANDIAIAIDVLTSRSLSKSHEKALHV